MQKKSHCQPIQISDLHSLNRDLHLEKQRMTEIYIDELQAWVKKREQETSKPRQDSAVVEFVGEMEHINAAREAGYNLRTIWEHMHATGRYRFSYETFRRHAKRLLSGSTKPIVTGKKPGRAMVEKKDAEKDQQTAKESSENGSKMTKVEIKGFKFNPVPNKEELF